MDLIIRIMALVGSILAVVFNTLLGWILPKRKPTYPPIRNRLLIKPLGVLVLELRQRKLTSVELVEAYISRIQDVNPSLNAVADERFAEALKEAQHADHLIAKASNAQLPNLFARYPLLGIPFTVKEACGVKGLSFTVGNMHRKNFKCPENGKAVELLRAAGCIPLLVSANPEFCVSIVTNTHTNGRCLNPYDLRRTPGGSSGGEAALNGCGASLFGIGSDIVGSIRLPALFCGVFGHKPTGGLISSEGHFPNTTDLNFAQYVQLGPITRFARDLPVLLQIMAGDNAKKLKFEESVQTKDIKIHYTNGFYGLNSLFHPPIDSDIKLAIKRAVSYFEKGGLSTKEVKIKNFWYSIEIVVSKLVSLEGIPSIMTQSSKNKPERSVLAAEIIRSFMGHSLYTKDAVVVEYMMITKALMRQEHFGKWHDALEQLRTELLQLLGSDGVLLMPTFHTTAGFHLSPLNFLGTDITGIINMLGFPATHVPMGLSKRGMPIGFQVVAAPYHDKLCLQIAAELETAFGGWVPPLPNEF